MSCCGDQPPIQFIWLEDGTLVIVDPDTGEQTPAPQYDPRNNSAHFPPIIGDDGDDKKCAAATSMVTLIKEQVGDQLTDDMSRYTLLQLITDWVNTMLQTSNIFEALLTIVANQIFALIIATLRPALTEEVYDTLQCIFYCDMSNDASFDEAQVEQVRSDITSQIGGIAGVFFEHLIFLLGVVGVTNLARSNAASEGDCSSCGCNGGCFGTWGFYDGDAGTTISKSDSSWEISSAIRGDGKYYVIIVSTGADDCCQFTSITPANETFPINVSSWCGNSPGTIVSGGQGDAGGGNMANFAWTALLLRRDTPFTVTVTSAT